MKKVLLHLCTQMAWFSIGVTIGIVISAVNAWEMAGGLVIGAAAGIIIENKDWDI